MTSKNPVSELLPVIDAGLPTGIVEPFAQQVQRSVGPFVRQSLTDLQINLGKLCNQTCTHCHVEAGPTKKRENMSARTANRIVALSEQCSSLRTVDLTGGAPEMNANFRDLVKTFRGRGLRVIDRCNLTIMSEPGYEWVAGFLAEHQVDVVASLPCYLEENVDGQRGSGVFRRSIDGLRRLNELGYGMAQIKPEQSGSAQNRFAENEPVRDDSVRSRRDPDGHAETGGLRLDLVFNPTSPELPPDQSSLEQDYKRELRDRYGIEFDHLLAIANIPIKRYARYLHKHARLDAYMQLLADHFNPAAAANVMCRSLISIGWEGAIYDCDFNQMLEIPAGGTGGQTIWSIDSFDQFRDKRIAVADHCYGCTAGAGSSCGGAIVENQL